jgi:hypothetical protein
MPANAPRQLAEFDVGTGGSAQNAASCLRHEVWTGDMLNVTSERECGGSGSYPKFRKYSRENPMTRIEFYRNTNDAVLEIGLGPDPPPEERRPRRWSQDTAHAQHPASWTISRQAERTLSR